MKFPAFLPAIALAVTAHAAEVPKAFAGLLEKDVPVRAQIGGVVPPAGIEKYRAKVEEAAQKDPQWFREYSLTAKSGAPLPFHEKLGLTREEYDDYLKLWGQREFKPIGDDLVLILKENSADTWSVTATGQATILSTFRYSPKTDTFRSLNGTMTRGEDITAEPDSILGAWTGTEWKFEEETSLGKTKENIAFGKSADNKFGIVVYRLLEVSSEGTKLVDKPLVIRFALGKPSAPKAPATAPGPAATPKKKK